MNEKTRANLASPAALAVAGIFGVTATLGAQGYPSTDERAPQPEDTPRPEAQPLPGQERAGADETEDGESIVDVIREAEELERFAEILDRSGYAERFEEELSALRHSETTVLAPHNEAFEDLPEEVIEKMKDPGNRLEVAEIIDSHLFPQGRTVREMGEAPALFNYSARSVSVEENEDGELTVRTEGAEVKIVEPDLEAADGYVHVVDDFLVASIDESHFEGDGMTPQIQQPETAPEPRGPQQPETAPQPQQPQQPPAQPQQPQEEDDDEDTGPAAPW